MESPHNSSLFWQQVEAERKKYRRLGTRLTLWRIFIGIASLVGFIALLLLVAIPLFNLASRLSHIENTLGNAEFTRMDQTTRNGNIYLAMQGIVTTLKGERYPGKGPVEIYVIPTEGTSNTSLIVELKDGIFSGELPLNPLYREVLVQVKIDQKTFSSGPVEVMALITPPSVVMKSEHASQVQPGEKIQYSLSVTNKNTEVLPSAPLVLTVPPELTFASASLPSKIEGGSVQLTFPDIQAGSPVTTTLTFQLQSNVVEGEKKLAFQFAYQGEADNQAKGSMDDTIVVQPVPTQKLSSIVLKWKNPGDPVKPEILVLPADGAAQGSFTIELLDQSNNPYTNPVEISCTISPADPNISLSQVTIQDGKGEVIVQVGTKAGDFTIVAQTGDQAIASPPLTLTLSGSTPPNPPSPGFDSVFKSVGHLWSNADKAKVGDVNGLVIYQLPKNIPVKVVSLAQAEFDKLDSSTPVEVEVEIWVAKVWIVNAQLDLKAATTDPNQQVVFMGTGKDDPMNKSQGERKILPNKVAEPLPVTVMEEAGDYVHVRIKGWVYRAVLTP